MGSIWNRDLAGLDLAIAIPALPIAIGWATIAVMTLLASLPAALALRRESPRALLATRG
jgi:hypothetical protein